MTKKTLNVELRVVKGNFIDSRARKSRYPKKEKKKTNSTVIYNKSKDTPLKIIWPLFFLFLNNLLLSQSQNVSPSPPLAWHCKFYSTPCASLHCHTKPVVQHIPALFALHLHTFVQPRLLFSVRNPTSASWIDCGRSRLTNSRNSRQSKRTS